MRPLDRLEAALVARACHPRRRGEHIDARCPAHEDTNPSLSVDGTPDTALICCHAGCAVGDILAELSLEPSDLYETVAKGAPDVVATYDYQDAAGKVAYCVKRYTPKGFRQCRPGDDGKPVWNLQGIERLPYRLPELLAGVAAGRHVLIVEGERDADNLRVLGFVATTNAQGAKWKWPASWAAYFKGAKVTILPDNDEPGREHAEQVAKTLSGAVAELKVLALPGLAEHGDVSDWIAADGTADELKRLIREARTEKAATGDEKPRRRLTYQSAATITPTPPEWLWKRWLLRRAVNLWTGRQGSGKTTFACHVISSRTHGVPLPGEDGPGAAMSCAFLSLEEPSDRVVARLAAAGADLEKVIVLGDVEDVDDQGRTYRRRWQLPRDISILGEVITEHQVGLCVVDGLGYSIDGDSHSYSVVGQALSALAGEAERTGAAILGLVHPPKGASDAVTSAIGSTAWTAIPRIAAVLGVDPSDETGARRVASVAKSNYRMPDTGLAFEIGEDPTYECGFVRSLRASDVAADDITAAPPSPAEKGERAEARELLRDLLASGPMDAADVAKAMGDVSRTTLKRARADLGVQSAPRRDQATGKVVGWILSLPVVQGSNTRGPAEGWSPGPSGHHQGFYNTSFPEDQESKADPLDDLSAATA